MGKLSCREMAVQIGGLKKSQVADYAKAGMPMDDVETARDWLRKSVAVRTADVRPRAPARERVCAQAGESLEIALRDAELGQGLEIPAAMPRIATVAPSAALALDSLDFDTAMLTANARILLKARAAVEEAMDGGDTGAFNFALGNFAKLEKEFVAARLRWLEAQQVSRRLISLDDAMQAIGAHEQEVRRGLIKFGDRNAARANPANPALAKRVLDEAMDAIFATFAVVPHAITKAYTAPTA